MAQRLRHSLERPILLVASHASSSWVSCYAASRVGLEEARVVRIDRDASTRDWTNVVSFGIACKVALVVLMMLVVGVDNA